MEKEERENHEARTTNVNQANKNVGTDSTLLQRTERNADLP